MNKRGNNSKVFRVIDANLNRVKEGLRVCEDTTRFIFDDKRATREFKKIRHSIDLISGALDYKILLKYRNVDEDVGIRHIKAELKRADQNRILLANIQRVKESLRVIEEFLKLVDERLAGRAKYARYRTYSLEKILFG